MDQVADLAAVNAFVTVGNCGGFRRAGSLLGMSSSGVSKAVARLEKRIGIQLLARTTRSVRLTPAGLAFHGRCKIILAELADAEHSAAAAALVPQGRLIISMTATGIVRNRVLPVIAEFIKRHPQVDIEARISDRLVDLVGEGVDLAVRIGHLPDSGLIALRLGETRLVLCGSPAYLAAEGVPLHPDELVKHRFVGFVSPGTATRFKYRFMVDGQLFSIPFNSSLTVDDGDALIAAALLSVGLIMVADYLVEDLLDKGRLVRLLQEYEMPAMPVNILRPPSRHLSTAARVLIDMLRANGSPRDNRGT